MEDRYAPDIAEILSHAQDNGGELWATPDRRLQKGSPFSTLESVLLLLELGLAPADPLLQAAAELIFSTWRPDGRFKLQPQGAIYPCQTIHAAAALCRMGYAPDARLQQTFKHLLNIQQADGGWKCNKFSFGRGPETEYSNPLPTLVALDAFRFGEPPGKGDALDRAVEFLLGHWTIRAPIGPCHYGIGTLFSQVEYPFRGYNIFFYVYVLSFYDRAREDPRFLAALGALQSRLADGRIRVERVVPKLAQLAFCRKGEVSDLATLRYREVLANLGKGPPG